MGAFIYANEFLIAIAVLPQGSHDENGDNGSHEKLVFAWQFVVLYDVYA